jgi:transposase
MHPSCQIEQVYLCLEPVDFRKSINGLGALVERELQLNPFCSALYVFANRHRTKIVSVRRNHLPIHRCKEQTRALLPQARGHHGIGFEEVGVLERTLP